MMLSYLVIFAAIVTVSLSFPQGGSDDFFGFPDDDEVLGQRQNFGDFQQNRPNRRPQQQTFNNFPPSTPGPSSTTVNVQLQSTTPATATTRSPAYRQCLASLCPTTNEYNPVCGSDNINYDNAQKLNCANFCGPRVDPNWRPVQNLRRGTCSAL